MRNQTGSSRTNKTTVEKPNSAIDAASHVKTVREEFEDQLKPVLELAFKYAVTLCGSRDDALDLVQDASVSAFRGFDRFEPGTNFKAWFLTILTNRYFRVRHDAMKTPSVGLDEVPELLLYREAKRLNIAMAGDPTTFIFEHADFTAIVEAFSHLADEFRVVASLHFLSDLSYADCADLLGVPIGTVRSRLHRARRHLQGALWSIAKERGYVVGVDQT